MKNLLMLLFVFFISILNAGEAVFIGTSQEDSATGLNNSRKIARTQSDRRIVLYQDKLNNKNAIYLTFSDNGRAWQSRFLDYGSSPVIAVSDRDSFYVSYTKSNETVIKLMVFAANDLPDLAHAYDIDIYYGAPGSLHAFPVLDVGPRFVHLTFQSTNIGAQKAAVRYGLFFRDLEPATSIFTVSSTMVNATQPTLQTDLEYSSDYVNIFWNEGEGTACNIHHLSLDADKLYARQPATENEFWLLLKNELAHIDHSFAQFAGCANPSVSVRTEVQNAQPPVYVNRLILGCDNLAKKQFNLFSLDYDTKAPTIDIRGGSKYDSHLPTWPSVDDIILNPRSCAILWENNGTVLYGQSHYADIVTDPPQDVSLMNASHYPSVCFKTFRSDSFDVVWTTGLQAPYSVYYKRLAKKYWFAPLEISVDAPTESIYRHPYEQVIRVQGGLNNKPSLKIVSGQLPDSLSLQKHPLNENEWRIVGLPIHSGTTPITLRAQDQGEDAGVTTDKKVIIDITNNAPSITVTPDSMTWEVNKHVLYQIEIKDAESNKYTWKVTNLPNGLAVDSTTMTITGTALLPEDKEYWQTTFHLFADDGDKKDSLHVIYIVKHPTLIAQDARTLLPQSLTLHQAYPNPFNPTTTIKVDVPESQSVQLYLFDLRGRAIKILHDGLLAAGQHQFSLNASDLSSGAYFIRLQTADKILTQKCILLK